MTSFISFESADRIYKDRYGKIRFAEKGNGQVSRTEYELVKETFYKDNILAGNAQMTQEVINMLPSSFTGWYKGSRGKDLDKATYNTCDGRNNCHGDNRDVKMNLHVFFYETFQEFAHHSAEMNVDDYLDKTTYEKIMLGLIASGEAGATLRS